MKKNKYYDELFGAREYGGYIVYDKSNSGNYYSDLHDQVMKYYNSNIVEEESEEQKAKRLAKEKAEKRNIKIDQILGK